MSETVEEKPKLVIDHKLLKTFYIVLLGQTVTLMGSALTNFGIGIWAYQQEGVVSHVTFIFLAASLPGLIFGPIAGAYVDRWDRRLTLILAQTGSAICSGLILFLYLQEQLELNYILAIVACSSICNSFLKPAFISSINYMVPKDLITKALGAVGLSFGMVQLFGPALAGGLMTTAGLKWVFIVDFCTFFFGIGSLLLAKIESPDKGEFTAEEKGSVFSEIKFALDYLREKKGMVTLFFLISVLYFNLGAVQVLVVPMALGFANEAELGLMQSVSGIGLLVGSGLMMTWGGPKSKTLGTMLAFVTVSIVIVLMPISQNIYLLGSAAILVMFCFTIAAASVQTIWQHKIAPDVQGRVTAFRTSVTGAMVPLAYWFSGWLADNIFEPLMMPGEFLAELVGGIYGVGQSRGVAVQMSVFGLITLAVVLTAWLNPNLRKMEALLPDYEVDNDKDDKPMDQKDALSLG